jgi:Ca2+-binding RTX toxin-like protein
VYLAGTDTVIGRIAAWDPEKDELTFTVMEAFWGDIALGAKIALVAEQPGLTIDRLRLGSVRYLANAVAETGAGADGTLALEGLALDFNRDGGRAVVIDTLDGSEWTTFTFDGISFENRDQLLVGIDELPDNAVEWAEHRAWMPKDPSGGNFRYTVTRTQIDIAASQGFLQQLQGDDLVALPQLGDRRFVSYNGMDEVFIHGTNGEGTFTFDNTGALTYAFGHARADQFFVGSIIETRQAPNPEGDGTVTVVETTAGTAHDTRLFGGGGNDYFQIIRNKAETWLYGDAGDDTFLVRATLGVSNLGSGKGQNNVGYNRNAPLHIDGGSGFNTFILEGTEIGDQFIVFVDDDGVQQIKGAGVDIGSLQNIQSIQINSLDGDDTIYLYGVTADTRIVINTGRGNDQVFVGGPARVFDPISQGVQLDTTAPGAMEPTIEYIEVEEEVPGYTRVERTINPDGTETVRRVFVPGYTVVKRIATVVLRPVEETTQSTQTTLSMDAVRVGRQDDLSAFNNLVVINGGDGVNTVDFQLFGTQDGSLADGRMSVTTEREVQKRALKALYGQSYQPSEGELVPEDSPDNTTYGWVTGFGGNNQGILLSNVSLVRIQLGDANNVFHLEGVHEDIQNAVISTGGGDDTVIVGRVEEIGQGPLTNVIYDAQSTDTRIWLDDVLGDAGVPAEWQAYFEAERSLDAFNEADAREFLLAAAVLDGVVLTRNDLEDWFAKISLADLEVEEMRRAWEDQNPTLVPARLLTGVTLRVQTPDVQEWFANREVGLALNNLTAQQLLTAAVLEKIDLEVGALTEWYNALIAPDNGTSLRDLDGAALTQRWEEDNPRLPGTVGTLEDIQSRAVLIGGTGNNVVRIYDNMREIDTLTRVTTVTLKPYNPNDPSTASAEEIAADPLQQRIDFTQVAIRDRYDTSAPTGTIAINGFSTTELYLGNGNDRIEIMSAILPIYIHSGGGDDEFFIGSTPDDALSSDLDGIVNTTLTLDAGSGSNRLVMSRGGDTDPTANVEITDQSFVVRHFQGDDLSTAPIVSAVRFLSNPAAGARVHETRYGFDRGVVLYTGDGDDKAVQVLSIHDDGPTRIYLGAGDDVLSVLPNTDAPGGENLGLRNLIGDDPHDLLQVFGGDGDDIIDLSAALVNVHAFGGTGDNIIKGSTGVDILIGGPGNNIIEGYGAAIQPRLDGTPYEDGELWGEQIEILVGDQLGRVVMVERFGVMVPRLEAAFIDANSADFDDRWMEAGGMYLFDRSDSPGQLADLSQAVDSKGILIRDAQRNYRGGDPRAVWNSLAVPSLALNQGGDDLIFSGIALPNLLGLASGTPQTDAALHGTVLVIGGAGADRIHVGHANPAHGHGHIIVGDEARIQLNRNDENGERVRMLDMVDVAAPVALLDRHLGNNWIQYGAGDAYVLSGAGHDVILGGLNPDGTVAAGTHQHRIVSDMGEIRLHEPSIQPGQTPEVTFMRSATDRAGGDDTIIIGGGDVDWIGGGGSDRIWIGFEFLEDLTNATAQQFTAAENLSEHGGRATDIFGRVNIADRAHIPLLYRGTELADNAEGWLWAPILASVRDEHLPASGKQNVNLIGDYGRIERITFGEARFLRPDGTTGTVIVENPYNVAPDYEFFDDIKAPPVVLQVSSVPPSDDFEAVFAASAAYSDIPGTDNFRGNFRGDGGHDAVYLRSAVGNIVLGEGDDILEAEDVLAAPAQRVQMGTSTGEHAVQSIALLPVAGGEYSLSFGGQTYTAAPLYALPTVAELREDLQAKLTAAASGAPFTIGADGDGLVLTWKDIGPVAEEAVLSVGSVEQTAGDASTQEVQNIAFRPVVGQSYTLSFDGTVLETGPLRAGTIDQAVAQFRTAEGYTELPFRISGGLNQLVLTWIEDGEVSDTATLEQSAVIRTEGLEIQREIQRMDIAPVEGARFALAYHTAGGETVALEATAPTEGTPEDRLVELAGLLQDAADSAGSPFAIASDGSGLVVTWVDNTAVDQQLRLIEMSALDAGLAVVADAGVIDRLLGLDVEGDPLDGNHLIRVRTTQDDTPVGIAGDPQSQTYRGGDDRISIGGGNHVVIGGAGDDVMHIADQGGVGDLHFRQYVTGDGGVILFDPRDAAAARTLMYFETAERDDPQINNAGTSNDDEISLGSGDIVVAGGVGADVITARDGRHIIAGDSVTIRTLAWDEDGVSAQMQISDVLLSVSGGDDHITSRAHHVIAIGGGGDDVMHLQEGMADEEEGRAIVIGDRGSMEFEVLTAGGDPLAGRIRPEADGTPDARVFIDLFDMERLARISGRDTTTTTTTTDAMGGDDEIRLGNGRKVVIAGGGSDHIEAGTGRAIVAGDVAEITLFPSEDDFILASMWSSGYASRLLPTDDTGTLNDAGGDDTIILGAGDATVIGGIGKDRIEIGRELLNQSHDAAHRYVVIGGSGAVTPTAQAYATAWGEAGNGLEHVSITGPDGQGRLALIETWETDSSLTGNDTILIGDGESFVLGGGGSDTIDIGSGPAVVFGDTGEISFFTDDALFTERTLTRLWQLRDLEAREAGEIAGDNEIAVGAGPLHVIFGGAGADSIWTQHETDFNDAANPQRSLIGPDARNQTYLAGDRAVLMLDPHLAGASALHEVAMLWFEPSDEPPVPGRDHGDTAMLGDGKLWAIMGFGSDTLIHGDGDAHVLGDVGSMRNDPATYNMVEMQSAPVGLAQYGGDNFWQSGDGLHVGILGRGDDTVLLGDGDVFVLLDHGRIEWAPSGNLAYMEDIHTDLAGNDMLIAGAGQGVVFGGGGDDTIWTGRRLEGDYLSRNNRDHSFSPESGTHILFGDLGTAEFDPTIDAMAPVFLATSELGFGGNDDLRGGAGNDIILGGGGSDLIYGDAGRDVLLGDYADLSFRNGLLHEIVSSVGSFGQGGGDVILTGHFVGNGALADERFDGALVLGGTMSNTFRVAIARDIVLETYGRMLFNSNSAFAALNEARGYQGWAAGLSIAKVENFGATENRFDRETRNAFEGDKVFVDQSDPTEAFSIVSNVFVIPTTATDVQSDNTSDVLLAAFSNMMADLSVEEEEDEGLLHLPEDGQEQPVGDGQEETPAEGVGEGEEDAEVEDATLYLNGEGDDGLGHFATLRAEALNSVAVAHDANTDAGDAWPLADDGLAVYDALKAGAGIFAVATMTRRREIRVNSLENRLRTWDGSRFVLCGLSKDPERRIQ